MQVSAPLISAKSFEIPLVSLRCLVWVLLRTKMKNWSSLWLNAPTKMGALQLLYLLNSSNKSIRMRYLPIVYPIVKHITIKWINLSQKLKRKNQLNVTKVLSEWGRIPRRKIILMHSLWSLRLMNHVLNVMPPRKWLKLNSF